MYADTIKNFKNAFKLYSNILFRLFLLYRHVYRVCQVQTRMYIGDRGDIRCTDVLIFPQRMI